MKRIELIAPLALVMAFLLTPDAAHAYVGPGLGAGTLAVVLGVVGSLLLALVAVVWYPLKRLMRRRSASAGGDAQTGE